MTSTSAPTASAALSGLANTAATTQVGAGADDSNMNEFLSLLTAQLKYQDPTNPTDPTQFVSQLAQFSTVEQLTKSNTTLDTISQSLSGMALGQYAGMIDKTVSSNASSVTVPASGGASAQLAFNVTSTSLTNLRVQVTNASGTVVDTMPVAGGTGSVTFTGIDSNGNALPAGDYTLSLVGSGSGGASQSAGTLAMSSQVTGVAQGADGTWQLQLQNGLTVDASTITNLN